MNQTTHINQENNDNDELLSEYNFDYSKARSNRFVQSTKEIITVTLDPDIAAVFKNSESVNNALRLLLAAIPQS
jgi:uncharacterized protein (DUF4415 family)